MKITNEGFVWLEITNDVAEQVYGANIFEVYELLDNDSEILIETPQQLQAVIDNDGQFGIEVGHRPKELYLLYSCDTWHSNSSMELMGVFSTHSKAVRFADEHSKKSEEGELTKHDVFLLGNIRGGIKQTQGRTQNYIINVSNLDEEI